MARAPRFIVSGIGVALLLALAGCTATGVAGPTGPAGPAGAQGQPGAQGSAGAQGPAGAQSPTGARGPAGAQGQSGAQGPAGPAGAAGATGSGDSALFYALMPGDNAATVAVGQDVQFPQDGPTTSSGITRSSATTFVLATQGVYRVTVQVPVMEAGQLVLTLNGADLAYTVTGRATGTTSIDISTLVHTTASHDVITVRNPAGNSTALTITPLAGGTRPVSATLLIELVKAD